MAARQHATRAHSHRQLTLKEWAELPEEVEGELVDGLLEEEEMASEAHELAVSWIHGTLFAWVKPRGGRVTGSESKYGVGVRRGRKPDVSVFLPGSKRPRGRDKLVTLAPDIAIEVITPTPRDTRRDRIDKARDYARFGVRWYWLVDPAVRTLEILELGAKARYVQAAAGTSGRIKVPGCRGLVVDLDDLWRYVDSAGE